VAGRDPPLSPVVEAFQLSTERRAAERQEFEQQAGVREVLGRLLEERQRQEEEQEEKEEVARLRREQVTAARSAPGEESLAGRSRLCPSPTGPRRSAHQALPRRGREEERAAAHRPALAQLLRPLPPVITP